MGLSEVFWAARAHCGRAGVPGGTGVLAAAPLAPTFQAVTFPLQQSYHQSQLQPPVLFPLALLCFASIHSPLPLFLTFPIHRIRHKQQTGAHQVMAEVMDPKCPQVHTSTN